MLCDVIRQVENPPKMCSTKKTTNILVKFLELSVVVLIILAYIRYATKKVAPKMVSIKFCDSDLGDLVPCSRVLNTLIGGHCRACPYQGICADGDLVGCKPDYNLIAGDVCLNARANPKEKKLLEYLDIVNSGIKENQNF